MNKGDFDRSLYYHRLSMRMGPHFGARKNFKRVGATLHTRGISAEDAEIHNRIARVRSALAASEKRAAQQLQTMLGNLNIDMVLPLLMSICHDIGLYMGGSILVGGMLGGIVGFMAGGVGAAPGAIAGGAAGAELGTVIMTFLGLKAVVETMLDSLPRAFKCYTEGFMAAWGPVENTCMHGNPRDISPLSAEVRFAEGHVILLLAFLTGLVAYLTRGKGDMKAVLAEIRANPRLGSKMADWLAQNGERLVKHPQLQRPMQSASHAGGPAGGGGAGATSAPARAGASTGTKQAAQSAKPATPPKPSLRPAAQMIGKTEGGPGVWAESKIYPRGADYQEQIAGVVRGVEYKVPSPTAARGEVMFDGYDPARKVLLDAKDWQGFPPSAPFWEDETLNAARRQIAAAQGTPIEWHFSKPDAMDAVRPLFKDNDITEIKLIHTPKL